MDKSTQIEEIYDAIEKGKIDCESHLKAAFLSTLLNFAMIEEDEGKRWTTTHPMTILSQIIEALDHMVETRTDEDGSEMEGERLDFMKQLRIRTFRIKRAVRNILKQEKDGET